MTLWTKTGIDINLGTQSGFAIASAMRGPDSIKADGLKRALTARFRHLATGAISNEQYGGYTVNTDPVSDADVEALEAEVRQLVDEGFGVTHYLAHIRVGADHLMVFFTSTDRRAAEEAEQLATLAWNLQGVALNHANKIVVGKRDR